MNTTKAAWRVVAELAASQHGAFHRDQAAHHLTWRRLNSAVERGELVQLLSDVFVFRSNPNTWRQRLKVLELTGATIGGRSAAALHRFDRFVEGKLEVVVRRGSQRRLPPHVVVHRTSILDDDDVTEIDGIRCTSVPRTLVDLAQVLPPRLVEPALDSALRSGTTVDQIQATIDRLRRPGRTGVVPLERLLHDPARAGTLPDSIFERIVERMLVEHGIPRPARQFEVEVGGRVRRIDLAWPAARVGVEAHSKQEHFGARAEHDDNRRDLELAAVGWEVLYLTWREAHQPEFFLRALRAVLSQRLPQAGIGS